MNGRVKVEDTTPVFDVRHICTYLLLTRVYVQERYFWLVRCTLKSFRSTNASDDEADADFEPEAESKKPKKPRGCPKGKGGAQSRSLSLGAKPKGKKGGVAFNIHQAPPPLAQFVPPCPHNAPSVNDDFIWSITPLERTILPHSSTKLH
jgi:hypothetical protein